MVDQYRVSPVRLDSSAGVEVRPAPPVEAVDRRGEYIWLLDDSEFDPPDWWDPSCSQQMGVGGLVVPEVTPVAHSWSTAVMQSGGSPVLKAPGLRAAAPLEAVLLPEQQARVRRMGRCEVSAFTIEYENWSVPFDSFLVVSYEIDSYLYRHPIRVGGPTVHTHERDMQPGEKAWVQLTKPAGGLLALRKLAFR